MNFFRNYSYGIFQPENDFTPVSDGTSNTVRTHVQQPLGRTLVTTGIVIMPG